MGTKGQKLQWDKWPSKKRDRLYKTYLRLRTYAATSRAFKCGTWTVKRYVEGYGWDKDLQEQDCRVRQSIGNKAVEERCEQLTIAEETYRDLAKDYKNAVPGSKPQIANAMANLGKYIELLKGEPTDRPETTSILDQIDQRYQEHMAELEERKRKRAAVRKKLKGKK